MRLLLAVALLICCGASAALPVEPRRDPNPLPPLDVMFAACSDQTNTTDIGPCVEELLARAISLAKPSFATGVKVGNRSIVLEPLSLRDIPEKPDRRFRFSARDLKVYGLHSLQVRNVTLEPEYLALLLSFDQLRIAAAMTLRYLFIRADMDVDLTLTRPSIHIESLWTLAEHDGKLYLELVTPFVDIEIEAFSTRITRLGGLGRFLQTILNNKNEVLLRFYEPKLERQTKRKLENEFRFIKLAN